MTDRPRAAPEARPAGRTATMPNPGAQPESGRPRPKLRSLRGLVGTQKGPVTRPADIIPADSMAARALIFIIAIIAFLACATICAALAVQDASQRWRNALIGEITVQIRPAQGIDPAGELAKLANLVRRTPGIGESRLFSREESLALLSPWLGTGFSLEQIALPSLVAISVTDPALFDLDAFTRAVETRIVGGTVDDHRQWTDQLSGLAQIAGTAGLVILLLFAVALSLTVFFATRAAVADCRQIIEVLHFVGAEDRFIMREFQRHFFIFGLKGGLQGGVAACLSWLALGLGAQFLRTHVAFMQVSNLIAHLNIGLESYVGVLIVIGFVTLATMVTARLVVRSCLAHIF